MCQEQSIGLQEENVLTISTSFFKPNHFHFNFMCVLYYTYYFNIVVHVFNLYIPTYWKVHIQTLADKSTNHKFEDP